MQHVLSRALATNITVADNADGMERTTTISVTAGQAEQTITVIQLSDDDLPMRFRKLADLHSSVISPNGKWVGGPTRHRA